MRSDDDQWGIAESVGVTALGVASGRAMETHRDDGLVSDPYAESFVRAAAGEVALPADPASDTDGLWADQSAYIGTRSRFFDRVLTGATAAGVRQVVLLAAGLDTRALRLGWPEGTVVYEIDQSGVLDFKDTVLDRSATPPTPGGTRVEVPVDLRHDWPAALRTAGFDPARPTAWLAEGLLPYLPAQAEADLFTRVQDLSAPGSRIAVEHFGQVTDALRAHPGVATMSERLGVDMSDLFYAEPRTDPAERLRSLGWTVAESRAGDLAERWGRALDPSLADLYGAVRFLDAAREA